jgi:hypothetical protein
LVESLGDHRHGAAAGFYSAVAHVLSGDVESATQALRHARQLDSGALTELMPVLLTLTATHPDLAALGSVWVEPQPDRQQEGAVDG